MSGEVEMTVGVGVRVEDNLEDDKEDLWFMVFPFGSSFHSRSH